MRLSGLKEARWVKLPSKDTPSPLLPGPRLGRGREELFALLRSAAAITCVKALVMPVKLGEILYWLTGRLGYERAWTLGLAAVLQIVAIGAIGFAAEG